jgi:hypothetical protein
MRATRTVHLHAHRRRTALRRSPPCAAQEAAGGEATKEEKFADVGEREEHQDEPQK